MVAGVPVRTEPMPGRPDVLVVDDHAGFRRLARRILEAAGLTVAEAADGAAAAGAARTLRPRLVLLDIQLPDTDGFALARQLARAQPAQVIVLTSGRDPADFGGRVESAPAAGFVAKERVSASVIRTYLSRGPRCRPLDG
jgi:two-component system nitrate/nitrite response regulator NarL